MTKYIVSTVLGLAVLCGSVWVIRGKAQAQREALNQARLNAEKAEKIAKARKKKAAPKPKAAPAPATNSLDQVASSSTAPADFPKSTPAPQPKPTPKPKYREKPDVTVTVGLPPQYTHAPATLEWANALDLSNLSAEDEERLGFELNRELNSLQLPGEIPGEAEYRERADRVAKPFSVTSDRKNIHYTITVLDYDAVNAFSTPGGYIYLSRGLFDLVGDDDDDALEFVLAHEIAHVDLKHTLRAISELNVKTKKDKKDHDTLKQCLYPVPIAYPDAMEYEADAWAWKRMKALGRSRLGALAFIRRFESYANDKDAKDEDGKPVHYFPGGRRLPEANTDILANHYRAHPSATERKMRADAIFTPSVQSAAVPAQSK
jgi:Peptidase family M48